MAYLNWKPHPVQQSVTAPSETPTGGSRTHSRLVLDLGLSEILLKELALETKKLVESQSAFSELRLDLPQDWIVFLKIRDGASRFLIAHPSPTEWVATFAFEKSHAQNWIALMLELKNGQSMAVHSLGNVDRSSNAEWILRSS